MTTQTHMTPARRFVAVFCALAFALSLVPAAVFAAPAQAQTQSALSAQLPDQRQIREFYEANKVNLKAVTQMTEKPSIIDPYAYGEVSESSLKDALATLNFIRYVAGLGGGVTLDMPSEGQVGTTHTEFAQAAALLTAANGKVTDKGVEHPEGMSDEMYDLGDNGAYVCNLYGSSGVSNLSDALLTWLYDSGSANIDTLKYRRWMLNPAMGKTGFGYVYDEVGRNGLNTVAAMYGVDASNAQPATTQVAWPAQNTPVELFEKGSAWSLSTGVPLDKSSMKVTLLRRGDNKVWDFSLAGGSNADGEFYVDNDHYGQTGCIIFAPKGLEAAVGQSYAVSIKGRTQQGDSFEADYDVNFFELKQAITSVTLDGTVFDYTGSAIEPAVTVKYHDTVLEPGRDYEVTYGNNVNVGTANVAVRGVGEYTGTLSAEFQIKDPNVSHDGTSISMYRLYNPNSGEHFYTASTTEHDHLVSVGWNDEGYGWVAPSTGDAVYRLYNPNAGEHFYTMDAVERDATVAAGWNDEGIGWYSGGEVALWRQYNPNAFANNHNYTSNPVEFDNLASLGWRDEGIGWYGVG